MQVRRLPPSRPAEAPPPAHQPEVEGGGGGEDCQHGQVGQRCRNIFFIFWHGNCLFSVKLAIICLKNIYDPFLHSSHDRAASQSTRPRTRSTGIYKCSIYVRFPFNFEFLRKKNKKKLAVTSPSRSTPCARTRWRRRWRTGRPSGWRRSR